MDESFRHKKINILCSVHLPVNVRIFRQSFLFARTIGLILMKIILHREMSISHRGFLGDSSILGYTPLYFGKQFTTLREILLPLSS